MRTKLLLSVVAVTCLIAALGCFTMALRTAGQRHVVRFAAQDSVGLPRPGLRARPSAGASEAASVAVPVRVVIPAIGLSASVVPIGFDATGHVRMPHPEVAGWYRWGAAPGAPGTSVLVGHVDSRQGPAVFYRLSGAHVGQRVRVIRADGSASTFTISRITVVAKDDFPSAAVFEPTAGATIRLVTCTGSFDADGGGYADSLIVWGHRTPS